MKSAIKRGQSQREPLYLQVEDALRREMAGMSPGERLLPERALAGRFGVSLITVREAIRILAAEGRLERIQGRGTFVCKPTAEAESQVALLIHHDVSSPRTSSVYLRLAQEIQELLDDEKIPSRLYISRRAPGLEQFDFHCPEFFQDLEENRICGVIGVLLAGQAPWTNSLKEKGISLIGFGKEYVHGAKVDRYKFFAESVEEFIRRGKRRLALLAWRGFESGRTGHSDAFRKVLRHAGLPIVEPWIKDDIYPALDGSGWAGFREIWSAASERPDGLIILDDFFLGGVSSVIRETGIKVPDQLEIAIQFSNLPVVECPFPVIAWQIDVPTIAKAMARAEIQILRGEKDVVHRIQSISSLRMPELDNPQPFNLLTVQLDEHNKSLLQPI